MTKEEKFKILIDYILQSEENSYYEYCLEKAENYIHNIFSSKHKGDKHYHK